MESSRYVDPTLELYRRGRARSRRIGVALQAYLYACADADGDPGAIPPGPWDRWADRHLDEINVERAAMLARGDDGVPSSMLRLAGLA